MALVTVTGSHLHKQALGGESANGLGGSVLLPADMAARKTAMRQAARARMAGLDAQAAGLALTERLLAAAPWPPGAVVAGFWPLPGEIDLRPLLQMLHEAGHRVVLPHTPPRGQPLVFRRWQPDTPMIAERFGTMRPDGPLAVPDVLLVPLLAFDRAGRRLGYGGGYYDRTLAGLPDALAIGTGFAEQEVADVPAEAHDRPLHLLATDRAVVDLRAAPSLNTSA